MSDCNCIEIIRYEKLKIHPAIFEIISLEQLDYLMQDNMTIFAYKSEAQNLIQVVRKKGTRKYSQLLVVRGIGTYFAHKRLLEMGEVSYPKVIEVAEPVTTQKVQEMFFLEMTALKRSPAAHGVVALIYKRITDARKQSHSPSLFEPHIKDITHSRSRTLRDISGYDGRAFNNALKKEKVPDSLLRDLKKWKE